MYNSRQAFTTDAQKEWNRIKQMKPNWYRENLSHKGTIDWEINDAYELYTNTKNASLKELLLGDMPLRSRLDILQNFGTTSGTKTTMELNTLIVKNPPGSKFSTRRVSVDELSFSNYSARVEAKAKELKRRLTPKEMLEVEAVIKQERIEFIRRGSVLNDGYWWPFKNDAWVIGGVHGLKIFHIALNAVSDDILWDSKAGRPRMLGRELIGLAAAGYNRVTGFYKDEKTGKNVPNFYYRDTFGFVLAPMDKGKAQSLTFTSYMDEVAKYKSANDIGLQMLDPDTSMDMEDYDFGLI